MKIGGVRSSGGAVARAGLAFDAAVLSSRWIMWTPVDQSRMLRTWAMAEVVNPRWAHNLVGVPWPLGLKAKMDVGQWDALTEAEWGMDEQVISQLRAPLLDGLLPLLPKWNEGELAIEAVADMRIMAFPRFLEKAASRRLADLAEAERGAGPAGRPEFIRAAMVGLPIAVGRTLDGPFTLMEGYTRCCCALRDHHTGLYDGLPMPMVVGVTERIEEWAWW